MAPETLRNTDYVITLAGAPRLNASIPGAKDVPAQTGSAALRYRNNGMSAG
jgi:hypothetical protein